MAADNPQTPESQSTFPALARDTLRGEALYHFCSFDLDRFHQIVGASRLYFSSTADFNDPFEVYPVLRDDPSLTAEELCARVFGLAGYANRETETPGVFGLSYPAIDPARDQQEMRQEFLRGTSDLIADILRRSYRVFCLSTIHAHRRNSARCTSRASYAHRLRDAYLRSRRERLYTPGGSLEHEVISEAGDFLFVPPGVPHEAINLSATAPARAVVARNDSAEQDKVEPYVIGSTPATRDAGKRPT
jgi:hypothetical protein